MLVSIYSLYRRKVGTDIRIKLLPVMWVFSLHSKTHPLFMKYSNGTSTQCYVYWYIRLMCCAFSTIQRFTWYYIRHYNTLDLVIYNCSLCTVAMQGEHKIVRLERQAFHVHFSYMLDEMVPDQLVPHLVERKLLSQDKANQVKEMSSQVEKVSTIIQTVEEDIVVGTLPTFCTALVSAGLPHIAKKLTDSEYLRQISYRCDSMTCLYQI